MTSLQRRGLRAAVRATPFNAPPGDPGGGGADDAQVPFGTTVTRWEDR